MSWLVWASALGGTAILDTEIGLHIAYCRGWGIGEAEMAALPEAPACIAYTRFVLARGMAGDLLDLPVALAPCIVGYAAIGRRLAATPAARSHGNPYAAWHAMYAGPDYQEGGAPADAQLERPLARGRG